MSDYHLFNLRSCVEFSSVAIRINQWINAYQIMLHDSIMKKSIAMDMPPPAIGKHSRSDEPGDDSGYNTKRVAKGHSSRAAANQETSGDETQQQQVSDSSIQDSMDQSSGNAVCAFLF